MQTTKTVFRLGTGAAINVELGWVPDRVEIVNHTDGDVVNIAYPSSRTMAFTSGSAEIKAGDTLRGATSLARGIVKAVLLASGTWAGGDAAGTIILDSETIEGTFASEAIYSERTGNTDDATGAAVGTLGVDLDTEAAADTGITPYVGVAGSNAKGFTIGSGVSESGKLLVCHCSRDFG